MAIVPEANAKKGSVPYSSRRKIRPIVRDETSDELAARQLFAQQQDSKLSAGPNRKAPSITSRAAGSKVSGGLGGGTFSPNSPSAHNPGNLGTT